MRPDNSKTPKNYAPVAFVEPAPDCAGSACICLCAARHRTGVCDGYLGSDGVLVYFGTTRHHSHGVKICGPCINDYPEMDSKDEIEDARRDVVDAIMDVWETCTAPLKRVIYRVLDWLGR